MSENKGKSPALGLTITNVSKRFVTRHRQVQTLENVSLSIQEGEFVCLLGPSGCGKSTLLNIVAGLETACGGAIYLGDDEVKTVGRERAMMFQEAALFPWLTVVENVEFGLKMAGVPKGKARNRAEQALKMVHLSRFAKSYVHELSGGMRQRVALARALVLDCRVLLMDEPFAALDSQTKEVMLLELQRVWMETKKTIIFVTHNVEEALLLADRILVMSSNPGTIKREFRIHLARPRRLDNMDLRYFVVDIMRELKEEVQKIAQLEYDPDWNMEAELVPAEPDSYMGTGV